MIKWQSIKSVISSFYFKIVVALILLLLFSLKVDFYQVLRLMKMVNPFYLIAIFLLITLDRICMSYKWNLLLKAQRIEIPLFDVIRTYYIGNFVGAFLPATVGTDITRAACLNKYKPDYSKVASSIVIERVLGFIVLNVFSLLSTFLIVGYLGEFSTKILWFNLIILTTLSLALSFSLSNRVRVFIGNRFRFLEKNAAFSKLKNVYSSYHEYRNQQKVLARFIAWTFLEQSFPIVVNFLIAQAFGLQVSFLFFMVAIPIFLFLTRIPIAPNILGIQEGMFVFLFSFAHVPATQAFTLGLAQHILTLLGMTPGFFFYLLSSKKKGKTAEVPS